MGEIKFDVSPGATLEGGGYNSPGLSQEIVADNKIGSTAGIKINNLPGNTISSINFNVSVNPFYISGTVTKNSANVKGAKVYLIDENTNELVETIITPATGEYKFEELNNKHTYHLAVSWTDELGNNYNAESKPFIVPTS